MNKVHRNNQLILRDFIGQMERNLLKKFKNQKPVITKDIISNAIMQYIKESVESTCLRTKSRKGESGSPICAIKAIGKENNCGNIHNYQQTHHCSKSSNYKQTKHDQKQQLSNQNTLMTLFLRNQEKIMDQQQQLGYMKRQRQIQFEMTRVFLKEYMKDFRQQNSKESHNTSNLMSSRYGFGSRFRSSIDCRQNSQNTQKFSIVKEPQTYSLQVSQTSPGKVCNNFINGEKIVQSVCYEDQTKQANSSKTKVFDQSPVFQSKVIRVNKVEMLPLHLQKVDSQLGNYSNTSKNMSFVEQRKFRRNSQTNCLSERENQTTFTQNQLLKHNQQYQVNQKSKVFLQLRKLQKFVFNGKNGKNKQNGCNSTSNLTGIGKNRSRGQTQFYNLTQSPTKQYYKVQNQSLKTIQSNLNTHIQLMQKFRDAPPTLESIVARQEATRKKMQALKDLQEVLRQKQITLNKQQAGMLRKQKSSKHFFN